MTGGTETLAGANSYSGPTDITGGILRAGTVNTLSAISMTTVTAGGSLDLNGFNQTVTNLANGGLVNMGVGTPPGTVLQTTSYVGQGGVIAMNTYFGGDNSVSDKLVIDSGSATGKSMLRFTNAGGPAGGTVANGILVVEAINGATTDAGAFAMGNRELRSGVADYRLFQGGLDGSYPDNWYLRSSFNPGPGGPTPPPGTGPGPSYPIIGPEPATYAATQPAAVQLGQTMLGTHDDRTSDAIVSDPAATSDDRATAGSGTTTASWRPAVWGRMFGQQVNNSYQSYANTSSSGRLVGMQTGIDLLRSDSSLFDGHKDYAGISFAYANTRIDVSGLVTNAATTAYVLQHTGALNLDAYSGGAYWTHYGAQGGYVDLVLQGTSYNAVAATDSAQLKTSGAGFVSSVEGGYPLSLPRLGPGFVLEPQAQLLWQWVSFGSGNDGLGPVALGSSSVTTSRVGLKGRWTVVSDSGQLWMPHVLVNFWKDFGGNATTLFDRDAVPLVSRAQYMDVTAGFTTKISAHLSGFVDAGYQFAVNTGAGERRNGIQGVAGLRVRW